MTLYVNGLGNACRNKHFVYIVISLLHANTRRLMNDVLRGGLAEIEWGSCRADRAPPEVDVFGQDGTRRNN